jgi:hypothetical protein
LLPNSKSLAIVVELVSPKDIPGIARPAANRWYAEHPMPTKTTHHHQIGIIKSEVTGCVKRYFLDKFNHATGFAQCHFLQM